MDNDSTKQKKQTKDGKPNRSLHNYSLGKTFHTKERRIISGALEC